MIPGHAKHHAVVAPLGVRARTEDGRGIFGRCLDARIFPAGRIGIVGAVVAGFRCGNRRELRAESIKAVVGGAGAAFALEACDEEVLSARLERRDLQRFLARPAERDRSAFLVDQHRAFCGPAAWKALARAKAVKHGAAIVREKKGRETCAYKRKGNPKPSHGSEDNRKRRVRCRFRCKELGYRPAGDLIAIRR